MKVILLQNIKKVGQKGDVKDLKEGYVRNSLLPTGLVKIATTSELKNLEIKVKKNVEYQNQEEQKIAELFKKIEGQVVEISEKKNEKGHLFAKLGKKEVIENVLKSLKIKIEDNWFELEPIKEIGDYTITLKHGKFSKNFIVRIN